MNHLSTLEDLLANEPQLHQYDDVEDYDYYHSHWEMQVEYLTKAPDLTEAWCGEASQEDEFDFDIFELLAA